MDERLISNQVFKEIQPVTQPVFLEPGTILYANEYSGREKVAMPSWVRNVFNSDRGTVGNNALVQLNRKIQALPNGPWYLDIHNDVIYIHNHRFSDPPVYAYSYQREDGELLSVSFETQYISKNRQGMMGEGFDSEKEWDFVGASSNGEGELHYTDYAADEKEDLKAKAQVAYKDYLSGKLSWEEFNLFNKTLKDAGIRYSTPMKEKIQQKYRNDYKIQREEEREATRQYYQKFEAAGGTKPVKEGVFPSQGSYARSVQQLDYNLQNGPLHLLKVHRDRILIELSGNNSALLAEYQKEIEQHLRKGDLESYLKTYFNQMHWFDDPGDPLAPVTEEVLEVDPRDYCGPLSKGTNMAYGYNSPELDKFKAEEGYKNLGKQTDILILSPIYYVDSKVVQPAEGAGSFDKVQVPRVKIFRRHMYKGKYRIGEPQWKVLLAYYSRRGASNDSLSTMEIQQMMWDAINNQEKTKIKKLVCRMTCIGNPILTNSKIISISNVGKKWSGKWRILNVTHQLTPGEGYTCQLELTQNNFKDDASGTSSKLSLNNGTVQNSSAFNFTRLETVYYDHLMKNVGPREADAFMMRLIKSREVDPEYYNVRGIVKYSTDTGTAFNKELHGWLSEVDDARIKLTAKDKQKYGEGAIKARKKVEELTKGKNTK